MASATRGHVAAPSPTPFESVVDPNRYRAPDVGYSPCAHGHAGTLCTTAGKVGRNGRTAAIGATLFWLTCPAVNNLIARMERHGIIATLASRMSHDACLQEAHIQSHRVYEDLAMSLLMPEQAAFFRQHFLTDDADSSFCSGDAPLEVEEEEPRRKAALNARRKYGNAAVCHATDLKCLHALAAQSLCNAPNPLGNAVLHYMLHLSGAVKDDLEAMGEEATDSDKQQRAAAIVDDREGFMTFVDRRGGWKVFEHPPLNPKDGHVDGASCCAAAESVLLAAEGHPLRQRKKHRKN